MVFELPIRSLDGEPSSGRIALVNLADLIARTPVVPWADDGKIPWHDADFSARMLREHLSQQHDRASRPLETIDRHVSWLHQTILDGSSGHVLDLGCGPGFYTTGLARHGHTCVGIDFSPAAIAYAESKAKRLSLPCEYRLEDLRQSDFGAGFHLVLFCFGELNTFSPRDAKEILIRARRALAPSGVLVLEVHSEEYVRSVGERSDRWFTSLRSVFADEPHLCLRTCLWHPECRAATEQHFVIGCDASYVDTLQAYSDSDYTALLREVGLENVERHAALTGDGSESDGELFVLVARA